MFSRGGINVCYWVFERNCVFPMSNLTDEDFDDT